MADQDLPPGTAPDSAPPWEDEAPESETVERDDLTADIFCGPAPEPEKAAAPPAPADGSSAAYTVLARKYRPQSFDDLIGQEAMVRTLTNAFATGRIAHAFMLTGVRGVGKTTTARLLARALNYESDAVHQPSVTDLATPGRHCANITEGRHIDVLELDAASRSRVDEMRELLDGVRYAPAEARYKVYVIDEVHMLSTAAFNALLKTLEEPPPHAKFIFATTEIRKVPVTILSRCQRFDLRRVEPDVLVRHLSKIATDEGARIDADALTLIARAAEGSVRDSLSLLDQAIVQGEAGQTVDAGTVRDMLGLADRAQTIALFEKTVRGEAGPAIEIFRTLYGFGADPATVVADLLEHCHGASVAKALGPDVLALPKDQAASLAALGAALSAGALSRVWQMLLKAHDEVRRAPDPSAAVEMALIRLAYAADLPGPEEALRALQSGEPLPGGAGPRGGLPGGGGGGSVSARAFQAAPRAEAAPAQPTLQSFDDVVRLIDERRDIGLKLDVEKYVRPISFRMGAITFEPAAGAPHNLAQRLVARLKEWTGQPWLVAAEGSGGAETLLEREKRERVKSREDALAEPFIRAVMDAFPGTELVEVRQLAAPEIAPAADEAPDDDDDDD
ncbi:MAG: DNA polymerase III subunit gamma/tau [Proteobacteria bacterium]|nr:DNA polymerase III subunit gamma/tau [Pseudomonadota bacterium]